MDERLSGLIGEAKGPAHFLATLIDTPVGSMIAIAEGDALVLLEFLERDRLTPELSALKRLGAIAAGDCAVLQQTRSELARYFAGELGMFTVPLAPHGTAFHQKVWRALCAIPAGDTISYGTLADRLGKPTATRAVARANGANPIAVIVPCHRVIGADGSLTGYGGGLWRKQALLDHERRFFGAQGRLL